MFALLSVAESGLSDGAGAGDGFGVAGVGLGAGFGAALGSAFGEGLDAGDAPPHTSHVGPHQSATVNTTSVTSTKGAMSNSQVKSLFATKQSVAPPGMPLTRPAHISVPVSSHSFFTHSE